jgi:hypothetical protein
MYWNRREVFLGYSMKQFSEVRSILSSNNIKYNYKVKSNYASSDRGHSGSFGLNMDYACQYYIYVHRQDYARACHLINRIP